MGILRNSFAEIMSQAQVVLGSGDILLRSALPPLDGEGTVPGNPLAFPVEHAKVKHRTRVATFG